MEQENPIFKYLKENQMTDLDEKSFLDKYSNPQKAKEIHSFMVENELTDLDEKKFFDAYLKKKEPASSAVPNLLKPLPQSGEQPKAGFLTSPSEAIKSTTQSGFTSALPKEKPIEPKDALGSYNPTSRIKLYNQAKSNIQKRIPDLVQQFNNAEIAGDQNAMQQLKGMIDGETKKLEYFDKAIQSQSEAKVKSEPSTFGDDLYNGLKMAAGTAMSAPKFIQDVAAQFLPFSGKRPVTGFDLLAGEGKKILEETNKRVEEGMKSRPYNGGVYDALKNGDYSAATSNAAHSFTVSLPSSLLMANPYTGLISAAGMAQENVEESLARKGSVEGKDYAIAALKASTEYAFENLFGTGRQLKELVSKIGKEAATEAIEMTAKTGLKDYLKKLGLNISEEAMGEGLTQIAQNAIDKADGKKIGLLDNVADATLIGLFGGGTQGTLTTTASHYIDRVRLKEAEAAKAKADELTEKALQAPNQVTADAIHREAEKLNDSADKTIEENNKIGANAPPEIVSQIEDNNKKIDELEATIAQSPPDIAEVLKAQLGDLQSKNDELIKSAEKSSAEKTGLSVDLDSLNKEEVAVELDKKASEFQKRTGYKPDELSFDDQTQSTLDRLEAGTPVDNIAVEEASNTLYAKYKQYENMLNSTSRLMTTEQIKGLMSDLEEKITRLENVKNGKDFNAEIETKTGPVEQQAEQTAAEPVSAEPQAVKSYADSIANRDTEAGYGAETVEDITGSQHYQDIIAAAKAEGVSAEKVIRDLARSRALDGLETREELEAVDNQIKQDLAAEAKPAAAPEVEPIDEFIDANYQQIMADLKLKNRLTTSGCGY